MSDWVLFDCDSAAVAAAQRMRFQEWVLLEARRVDALVALLTHDPWVHVFSWYGEIGERIRESGLYRWESGLAAVRVTNGSAPARISRERELEDIGIPFDEIVDGVANEGHEVILLTPRQYGLYLTYMMRWLEPWATHAGFCRHRNGSAIVRVGIG